MEIQAPAAPKAIDPLFSPLHWDSEFSGAVGMIAIIRPDHPDVPIRI